MRRLQWTPPTGRGLARAALIAAMAAAGVLPACIGDIGDAGSGSGTGEEDSFKDGPGKGPQSELEPAPAHLRRLLARQYRNAVGDLLGEAAAAAAAPPLDSAINGFESIGASQLAVGGDGVAQYEASARGVAAAAMGDQDRIAELLGCVPEGPSDAACHQAFVERLGRLAWRRPLTGEEIAAYTGLATEVAETLGDFHAGVEYVVSGLLQSPNFLYRVEIGEDVEGGAPERRLDGYELAAKMSFFLLDTTPSAALLDAAAAGELDTVEGLRDAARSLVEEPAAREAIAELYSEVLALRELDALAKDAGTYPDFSPALAQSMKEETLRLIDDVFWERDADVRELYSADYTFVDGALAGLYGVDAPASGWEKVSLPGEQGRRGLLGQASFLSLFAHNASTSPTLRGKFVRERLLCQSIPAPPNDVITEIPEDTGAKTMKDKLAEHQVNPSCAGCHTLMDGIGLSLESFDGVGSWRTTENGVTIDLAGELDGTAFVGPAELAELLGASDAVARCTVRSVFRHATGHVETEGEAPAITALVEAFAGSGHRMRDLLVETVASEAFRFVGVEP